jgi:class 3 adenylate cyclase
VPDLPSSRRCRSSLPRPPRLCPALPADGRAQIATGLVVVGDLIGSGEAQQRGIVGETPNLALPLQLIAEPNTVVIADSTRQLLGNLFELTDLARKFECPFRATEEAP